MKTHILEVCSCAFSSVVHLTARMLWKQGNNKGSSPRTRMGSIDIARFLSHEQKHKAQINREKKDAEDEGLPSSMVSKLLHGSWLL